MTSRLKDYPGLGRWLKEHAPSNASLAEIFVRRTCELLDADSPGAFSRWNQSFREMVGSGDTAMAAFLSAEEIFQRCDVEFLELLSDVSEQALRSECGDDFFASMQAGADTTGLIALRFLSAWTALNTGRLELCVEECEKVNQPYASIYTLQGQALLESGLAKEAAEVLDIAVRLAPQELLAWFQLAKAHLVVNNCDAAWNALIECQRLAPQSDEIALMMGFTALTSSDERHAKAAWTALKIVAKYDSGAAPIIETLCGLALKLEDEARLIEAIDLADWPRIAVDKGFLAKLAPLLKKLYARSWMTASARLLCAISPDGTASA